LKDIQKIWNEDFVKKEYAALCFGSFAQKCGRIELNQKKTSNESVGMKMKVAQSGGLRSISKYEVVLQNKHCTLVRVEIETGRTHQIRAHFSHINRHLLGDKRYGNAQNDEEIEKLFGEKITRLMLHSRRISFVLGKRNYDFEAQIPDIFYKFVK
jgi:23S rRNA-/tRNA-specific pseudouridylate synthase